MTCSDTMPLPSECENCCLVTITEEDVDNSVKIVPKLETVVSIRHFFSSQINSIVAHFI